MRKVSVRDLSVQRRRVFVRVDFNVPLTDRGEIADDFRIRMALPTIRFLLEERATVILASHLGKPKGKPDAKFSLKPIAVQLERLLGEKVFFAPDCIGPEVVRFINEVPVGSVVLLENLRFHPGEEKNLLDFAEALARLADFYVNDAFSTAHRAHASTYGMTRFFAQPAGGLLMEKELNFLSQVIENPKRPFVVIIGGAKVSDKAGVIANLLPKVDFLLVGGGVAFNFLKSQGYAIGKSLFEPELMAMVNGLKNESKIVLPVDLVVAPAPDKEGRTVSVDSIAAEEMGLDIGPRTAAVFGEIIKGAKTVVWAGPVGMFEQVSFAEGTKAVAQAVASATELGAVTVVGGGDTVNALRKFNYAEKVGHISTGGSATLEFLEGKVLPGVAALADAK